MNLKYLFCDREFPKSKKLSDYATLDFVSNGSHLYGKIMWPDGDYTEPRPCVILFHGFPGSARNDDISHALCRAGCVVLSPHFRGAWGSEGSYSLSHCIEDAVNISEYVHSSEFCQKYNTDPQKIFLIGHSMGGCTVLSVAKKIPWLKGICAITPFDPTYYIKHNTEALKSLLEQGQILNSAGLDSIYNDMLKIKDEIDFNLHLENLKNQNLLILLASFDSVAPCDKMVEPFWDKLQKSYPSNSIRKLVTYAADHGLLGCRVECIKEIGNFIQNAIEGRV